MEPSGGEASNRPSAWIGIALGGCVVILGLLALVGFLIATRPQSAPNAVPEAASISGTTALSTPTPASGDSTTTPHDNAEALRRWALKANLLHRRGSAVLASFGRAPCQGSSLAGLAAVANDADQLRPAPDAAVDTSWGDWIERLRQAAKVEPKACADFREASGSFDPGPAGKAAAPLLAAVDSIRRADDALQSAVIDALGSNPFEP